MKWDHNLEHYNESLDQYVRFQRFFEEDECQLTNTLIFIELEKKEGRSVEGDGKWINYQRECFLKEGN